MLGDRAALRYRGAMRFAVALALSFAAFPAAAQDNPLQGIGFAQAEEGTWLCRHEAPLEALACAQEHCAEQAPGEQCAPTAWCYPAGWSGVMTVWLPDVHVTRVLCGMSDEASLTEMLKTLCATAMTARSCDLALIVDPDGNERQVEGVSFPGGSPVDVDAGVASEGEAPSEVGAPNESGAAVTEAPPAAEEAPAAGP
jgi:hypothetical protein